MRVSKNTSYYYGRQPSGFIPDAITSDYMTAEGIPYDDTVYFAGDTFKEKTGKQWWQRVDAFVKNIKGTGTINSTVDFLTTKQLFALRIMCGGSALRNSINLVNPATHTGAFFGTWLHTSDEAIPDGDTAYMDTGVTPSDFVNAGSMYFGCYCGRSLAGFVGYKMGVTTAGKVFGMFNYPNSARFSVSSNGIEITDDDFRIGNYSVNRVSTTKTKGIRHGVEVIEGTESVYASFTGNIYLSAINSGGTASTFDDSGQKMDWYFNQGLSASELLIWDQVITDFLASMGCALGVMDVYGDSIIINGDGSIPIPQRTTSLVAAGKNWIVRNYGKSGTSVENAVPVNAIGFPNFYDQRLTVRAYYPNFHKCLMIGYTTNDIGLNYATYNTTNFSSQLTDAVDYINTNQGYPFSKMVFVGHTYLVYPDAGDYYVTHYAVPVAADATRDAAFRVAYSAVASSRSIIEVNSAPILQATAGSLQGDGIHPTSIGCGVYAQSILSGITSF